MKLTNLQNTALEIIACALAASVLLIEFGAVYVNVIKPLMS